jgi:hypothetical protein
MKCHRLVRDVTPLVRGREVGTGPPCAGGRIFQGEKMAVRALLIPKRDSGQAP